MPNPPLDEQIFSKYINNLNDVGEKFCSLCYVVFERNADGKELLKALSKILDMPVCDPQKDASWGYYREGQNSVIRQIKNAVQYYINKQQGDSHARV